MNISLDHLDLPTRVVAVKLLRQDVDEAKAKMILKPGQLAHDSKIAIDVYLADLEAETAFLLDEVMAASIAQAVRHDDGLVAALLAQERQAECDRRAALQLHENGHLPDPSQQPPPAENVDISDELRDQLEARYNLPPRDDDDDIYSADLAIQKLSLGPKKVRQCLICTERFPFHDLARLPCAHEYCRGCLQQLFTSSLTDETLFPARCCKQNIPINETLIKIFLGGELVGKYLARKIEMETPNRTYCHEPACSTFVPPQGIKNDVATCPKCESKTCAICKAAAHVGVDCPKDEAAQQVLALAKKKGWKQCHACNKLVELTYGCNHMSKSTNILHLMLGRPRTDRRTKPQPVDAALNSATPAVQSGNPWDGEARAGASCLTSSCSSARPSEMRAATRSSTSSPRPDSGRLSSSSGSASSGTTTASTPNSRQSGASLPVTGAATSCRNTSSSVGSVTWRSANDAKTTA